MSVIMADMNSDNAPQTYRTRQEIFDIVARHLLTQGEKSTAFKGGGLCQYRGYEGLKCAIGSLIPDEEYKDWFEGSGGVGGILTIRQAARIAEEDVCFAAALQRIHDFKAVKNWPFALREVAIEFGVNASVLDEFKKEEAL